MSPRELGGLVITPGQGADISVIRMHTAAGCPNESDGYYAKMTGKGFPADGQIITATTDVGLSHTAGFDVYLAQTLKDFAADNNTVLQGKYGITVRCVDSFSQAVQGEFTASLEFGGPTKYAAVGAAKGPDRIPASPAPPGPETLVAPPPPVGSTVASEPPTAAASAQAVEAKHSSSWFPILIVVAFVVVLAAVVTATVVIRRRARKESADA
ncbi:hypothetical protein [Actinocrispum wychmicini]|uniref:Uncharacterized protein n=1 Tax=Actinocrispum wychmicini TaxID=1213861 RepID=A0A4R2JTT9_9PSEU|nr:hypothetical protein [Actinocrispum wychmicini]TCO62422.1 hypothetical protein EV192_102560 [Actinocrispum wychmicini]